MNCNIKLINKIPVIFHNLKGYDSYHIMQEISMIDFEIIAITNGLENIRASC